MVKIVFKTLKHEIIEKDINLDITIADLKDELTKNGYFVDELKLIFKGKVLEDNKTLMSYNYNPESKDYIVIMTIKKPVEEQVKKPFEEQVKKPDEEQVKKPDEEQVNTQMTHQLENNQQVNNEEDDDYEDVEDETLNMVNVLSQNPNILLGLIAQDPEMSQLFNQHPNFMQTVLSVGLHGAFGDNPHVLHINITEDDRNDINELMALGFTENEVIQVYYACNKNKEQAASMLFEDNHM